MSNLLLSPSGARGYIERSEIAPLNRHVSLRSTQPLAPLGEE